MTNIDLLGFIAAFATTFSFLPQAIQVLKTRDTKALSLAMYSIFTLGVALWIVYGCYKKDYAVIVANMITLILAVSILATKIYTEYIAKVDQGPECDASMSKT